MEYNFVESIIPTEGLMQLSMICSACGAKKHVDGLQNSSAIDHLACPNCGTGMTYADPVTATALIVNVAVPPVQAISIGRIIGREVVIGLAWGLAIASLVIYPLCVQGAYRDINGQIIRPYAGVNLIELGEHPPPRFELNWLEWLELLIQQCGPLIGLAVLVGLAVGLFKCWLRHPKPVPQKT